MLNITNLNASKRLLEDQSIMSQMQGEFSIIKGYGNDTAAALWAVTNPHKPKNQDYYVYTVEVLVFQSQT